MATELEAGASARGGLFVVLPSATAASIGWLAGQFVPDAPADGASTQWMALAHRHETTEPAYAQLQHPRGANEVSERVPTEPATYSVGRADWRDERSESRKEHGRIFSASVCLTERGEAARGK